MAPVRTPIGYMMDVVIGPGVQAWNPAVVSANFPEPSGLGVPVGKKSPSFVPSRIMRQAAAV